MSCEASPPGATACIDADAIAIRVRSLCKCYPIYARPEHRLMQSLLPRIQRRLGRPAQRYYREFWALRDVSLDVRKGQTLGIIGRNGSGKSSLLQMVCGTLTPTDGTVAVEGRVAALLELGSGFNPEFSGRENVCLSAAVLGLNAEQIATRYAAIVAFADIGQFIEQPVKTYSSGMCLRLAFAVIAHVDADILVIDEALAVGDTVFTQKCMRFLRSFMQHGTLLFASHDIASVLNLCRQVAWLDQGTLRMCGDAKAVTDAYSLECMQMASADGVRGEAVGQHVDAPPHEAMQSPSPAGGAPAIDAAIQVSFFDNIMNSEGWTTHQARLLSAAMTDGQGKSYASFAGGEHIELTVTATALSNLPSPIIGFLVKDRLGQGLFGANTWEAAGSVPAAAGQTITARFVFRLPMLNNGEYSMTVAIADGTPEHHIQHHWLHDAVILRVATAKPGHGLVGIAFAKVILEVA